MAKTNDPRRAPAKRPLAPKERVFAAAAVVLSVLVALGIAEVALRAIDFNPARINAGFLQFGYQTGIPKYDEDGVRQEGEPVQVRLFQPDPELLWTTLPGTPFTDSLGFRGKREYSETKPRGTVRVLFLGDSCTFLGDPVYPEVVQRELSARFPGKTIECLNASVPGYSSFQGSKLIERLRRFQPDFVSVYFGWNDHWRAQGGLTDRMQYAVGHGLRLVGLFEALSGRMRREPVPRVPLAEFEANLGAIRAAVSSWPATVVFVTAPTAFRSGEMPEWSYDFFGQYYHMDRRAVEEIPELHGAYADVVRRVSRHGAILVDAAEEFSASGVPSAELFRTDSIHLLTPGHERVGHAVAEAIAASLLAAPDLAN